MSLNEAIKSLDIGENYRLNLLDEVQSIHWSNDQITVMIATHYKCSDDSQFKSFICISECLLHNVVCSATISNNNNKKLSHIYNLN